MLWMLRKVLWMLEMVSFKREGVRYPVRAERDRRDGQTARSLRE